MNHDVETYGRIRRKLQEVRERELSCFGADGHRFQLRPPISDEAVRAFEQEHGVILPADYRGFLTNLGNGGAGPFYGLLPLEKWNDAMEEMTPRMLAAPSILTPDLAKFDPANENPEFGRAEFLKGAITICHQGCTYYAVLIVTGPHRGRVVNVSCEGLPCYFVVNPDFISWYERWLDELLGGYDMEWFGYGKPFKTYLDRITAPGVSAEDIKNGMMKIRRLADSE